MFPLRLIRTDNANLTAPEGASAEMLALAPMFVLFLASNKNLIDFDDTQPRAKKKAEPFGSALVGSPAASYSPVPPLGTVPSALEGLTAVFGMGTGVSPPPWRPET